MSLRTSATRYAKALFDVALAEQADLSKVGQDVSALAELFASNQELRLAAGRAGVPDSGRVAIVEQIADRLGVSPQVKKLVANLTQNRRLDLLKDLADVYNERLLAHQNVVRAEVTSAAPLSPEKIKALEESLSKVTGKKVDLSVNVDPALLGGVVARIGSTVYDGSVKTQLQRMRHELVDQ